MTASTSEQTRTRWPWATVLGIGAVLALGFFVRAYHYNEESVCLEEWVGFEHLDAPNLLAYIAQTRDLYKTMAPVYYGTEYLWAHVFGPSVASVRIISVLAGTLVLPLMYCFVWHFFGRGRFARRAALVAMLGAALSPMHVYHSQEARQYAFFILMAMASGCTLLQAVRGGRWYWWPANVIANLAVAFTHPFGILLPFAEGVYMLLVVVRRRQFKWPAIWILSHVGIAALSLMWMRGMEQDPNVVFGPYAPVLSLTRIFNDILADDIPGATPEFAPTGKTWPFLSSAVVHSVVAGGILRRFLILSLTAAIVWTAWRSIRAFSRPAAASREEESVPAEDYILLLLWLFIPPLLLAAVSAFHPCHMPRYTVYSSLALYVMVGGAVAWLPWRALRGVATAAVAVAMGYFLSIGVPGLNNVDWRSIAKLVDSSSPNDPVLVHGTDYLRILQFHLDPKTAHPAASVMSREGLCDITDYYLSASAQTDAGKRPANDAWDVITLDNGPPENFENGLKSRGLQFEKTAFSGIRHFIIYRVTRRTPGVATPPQFAPMTHFTKMISDAPGDSEVKRFRRQTSWDLDSWGGHYLRLGMALVDHGSLDLAALMFSKTLEFHPQYASEWIDLGHHFGDRYPLDSAMMPALQKGLASADENMKWWVPSGWSVLGQLYLDQHDYAHAVECISKSLELDSSRPSVYGFLATAYMGKGEDDKAEQAARQFVERDPQLGAVFREFLNALFAKQYDAAWAETKKLQERGTPLPEEFLAKLQRDSGRNQP